MDEREINEKALDFLNKHDWISAQKLLFKNANQSQSHNAYNNLGFYLITEGLACKNEMFRNAYNLGTKYLLRAAEIKETAINDFAITTALNYKFMGSSFRKKHEICKEAICWLKKGLSIELSHEMKYNLLRFLYFYNPQSEHLLNLSNDVANSFPCQESIGLRLEILRLNKFKTEGIKCIKQHRELLDEVDLLMFYTSCGMYKEGFELCERVCRIFSIDKFIASAIIECCIKTNHNEEAQHYANMIQQLEKEIQYDGQEEWCCDVLGVQSYRKKMILDYRANPAFIATCCYFGCNMHGTPW